MGLVSSFKKIKLRKIQPGKILKKVVHAGAILGVPGAKAADSLANRVGKRVDDVNRVAAKAKAAIQAEARAAGVSEAEAADRLAGRAIAGAEAGLTINSNVQGMLFAVAAFALVFFVMKGR